MHNAPIWHIQRMHNAPICYVYHSLPLPLSLFSLSPSISPPSLYLSSLYLSLSISLYLCVCAIGSKTSFQCEFKMAPNNFKALLIRELGKTGQQSVHIVLNQVWYNASHIVWCEVVAHRNELRTCLVTWGIPVRQWVMVRDFFTIRYGIRSPLNLYKLCLYLSFASIIAHSQWSGGYFDFIISIKWQMGKTFVVKIN